MYNVYGRIVFRKGKGCAHFYKLLNATKRHNGWRTARNSMEKESLEHFPHDTFCDETFHGDIKKILKLNNFNTGSL